MLAAVATRGQVLAGEEAGTQVVEQAKSIAPGRSRARLVNRTQTPPPELMARNLAADIEAAHPETAKGSEPVGVAV